MPDEKGSVLALYHRIVQGCAIRIVRGFSVSILCWCYYIISLSRNSKRLEDNFKLSLVEYVLFLFCATVLCRPSLEEQKYDFRPFWSYFAILDGRQDIASESIMNVVVFLPLGMILGMAFRTMTCWQVLFVGLCISTSIEVMQFILWKGFAELDDVIHNTLGCIIGFCLYPLLRFVYKKVSGNTLAVL